MNQRPLGNLPSVGWDRQQKKQKTIAERLAEAAQNRNRMSRFARGGTGAAAAGSRPYQGSAGAARFAAMGKRATPAHAAMRGVGMRGMFGEMDGGGPAIHVGPPPAAPSPAAIQGTLGGPQEPPALGDVGAPVGTGDPRFDPNAPTNRGGTILEDYSQQREAAGGTGAQIPFGSTADFSGVSELLGGTSSGNIGGLVPLGGGVYMDPSTGAIYGGSQVGYTPGLQL